MKKYMTRVLLPCLLTTLLAMALSIPAMAQDSKPCPWRIGSIEVGKWMNGNQKARIWINGSFPIPPGVSERPVWFVNGRNVGHSTIFFNQRTLPNSSYMLQRGQNTIEVKFLKPPYNGASHSYTFNFDWNQVRPGQHKRF